MTSSALTDIAHEEKIPPGISKDGFALSFEKKYPEIGFSVVEFLIKIYQEIGEDDDIPEGWVLDSEELEGRNFLVLSDKKGLYEFSLNLTEGLLSIYDSRTNNMTNIVTFKEDNTFVFNSLF